MDSIFEKNLETDGKTYKLKVTDILKYSNYSYVVKYYENLENYTSLYDFLVNVKKVKNK